MIRIAIAAALGAVISLACNRRVEEETSLRSLCSGWCERFVECGANEMPDNETRTQAECTDQCAANHSNETCPDETAAMLRCEAGPGMECPTFASIFTNEGGSQCQDLRDELTVCNSKGGR